MHQRISTPPEPETFAVGFFVNAPSERIVAIYCRAGFLVSFSSRRDELLVRIPDQLQAAFALELPNEVTHSVEKQLLPSTAYLAVPEIRSIEKLAIRPKGRCRFSGGGHARQGRLEEAAWTLDDTALAMLPF